MGTSASAGSLCGNFDKALDDSKVILDMRYRYENVDQASKTEDANASTLRTRFGFQTGVFCDLQVLVEAENVSNIGDEEYNDFKNGNVAYPVVADPDGTELNRAQVTYTGLQDTAFILGRQRINLGNQRFVGAVGWRQNEQTYDAVVFQNKSIENLTFTYGYVNKVHRIFGDDSVDKAGNLDTQAHAVNVDFAALPFGTLTGYGYFLDVETAAAASSATYGVRLAGKQKSGDVEFVYGAEFARQTDYADQPGEFELDYYNVEAGIGLKGFMAKVNYEVLGGDGAFGFQTPLATLHKIQGFADVFLSTPGAGIQDLNGSVKYTVKDLGYAKAITFGVWYHDFQSDVGSIDYGSELDILLAYKFDYGIGLAVKYADYEADAFAVDIQKLWVTLSYKY
jgi:hypothetical protein